MSEFTKEDMVKFMAYMKRKRAEENGTGTSAAATYTETSRPEVKATTFQSDMNEDQELNIKYDFLLEERIRCLTSHSKFYEALSLFEEIDTIDKTDIGIKLLKAECYIQLGRENKAEKTIKEIEKILLDPPMCNVDDVFGLSKIYGNNSSYIRALILLRIASDMFMNDASLTPDETSGRIFRCIFRMDKLIDEMVKPKDTSEDAKNMVAIQQALTAGNDLDIDESNTFGNIKKSNVSDRTLALASDYGVDVMHEMLEKMKSIETEDQENKVVRIARAAFFIGTHYGSSQFTKEAKILKYGIDLMDQQFGNNAGQHSIYGTLLDNLGAAYHNVERFKEAEPYMLRALAAFEIASDYDDEQERQAALRSTRHTLRITQSHMKLA